MTRSQAWLIESCARYGCHPGDMLMAGNGGRKRMMKAMIADGLLEAAPPFKITQAGRDALTRFEGFPVAKKKR